MIEWDTDLERQLAVNEGVKNAPYKDTLGNWTVGVGYNLSGRGAAFLSKAIGRNWAGPTDQLTDAEIKLLLKADIAAARDSAVSVLPEFERLDEPRQSAFVDFVFNVGATKAKTFKSFLTALSNAALQKTGWDTVALEMLLSLWAIQVGQRAQRLARVMRTGKP